MKKLFFVTIGSLILISLVGILTFRYFYYLEYNSIKTEFSKNPAVKDFEMHVGNYDIDVEEIYADLTFQDGTEMRFVNLLYPKSHRDTTYVEISIVDNWGFETHSFLQSAKNYYTLSSLKFGKHGQLNNYIDSEIINFKDAINQRNEIVELVNKIPEYPEMVVIEHLDWHDRPTITFISKYPQENKPNWSHDKFENKYDSLISISNELKIKKQLTTMAKLQEG